MKPYTHGETKSRHTNKHAQNLTTQVSTTEYPQSTQVSTTAYAVTRQVNSHV